MFRDHRQYERTNTMTGTTLNSIRRIVEHDGDYIVLVDYGIENLVVLGQAPTLEDCMKVITNNSTGSPTSIVKLVRVTMTEDTKERQTP